MPDLWMDTDTALAEVPVNVLPLLDDTDFKTIEDAVVYNAAGMALFWHFVTTAGAYTVTAVTPTTAGDYDWTDQGTAGIYTIEIPASGGASINNDTEGFGWFTGKATGVLPWRGPVCGFRASALNNALIDANPSARFGLDLDNVGLTNGASAFGIQASGTLSGTHSTTTADLGANAPSVDISGMTLFIPVHGLSAIIDSYNTGTGVATFSPATAATLANADAWFVAATPKGSTGAPLPVNLTQIGGDAQSATDLKDFADAGYDPSTNKVQGVVLVDTVTTYTGNTVQTGDSFARLGAPAGASVSADIATKATPAQILTTALTEAYAADGAAGTLSQILFALQAFMQERAVSGTTLTLKKLDGITTAMTFTLSDATSPVSITRAT